MSLFLKWLFLVRLEATGEDWGIRDSISYSIMFFATTIRRTPETTDSYILILSFREHSSSWQGKDGGGTRFLLSGQEVETNECQYPGVFSFSPPQPGPWDYTTCFQGWTFYINWSMLERLSMHSVQMHVDLLGNYIHSQNDSKERPLYFYKTFIMEILHNLKTELSYDSTILLLGIYPQEIEWGSYLLHHNSH